MTLISSVGSPGLIPPPPPPLFPMAAKIPERAVKTTSLFPSESTSLITILLAEEAAPTGMLTESGLSTTPRAGPVER